MAGRRQPHCTAAQHISARCSAAAGRHTGAVPFGPAAPTATGGRRWRPPERPPVQRRLEEKNRQDADCVCMWGHGRENASCCLSWKRQGWARRPLQDCRPLLSLAWLLLIRCCDLSLRCCDLSPPYTHTHTHSKPLTVLWSKALAGRQVDDAAAQQVLGQGEGGNYAMWLRKRTAEKCLSQCPPLLMSCTRPLACGTLPNTKAQLPISTLTCAAQPPQVAHPPPAL